MSRFFRSVKQFFSKIDKILLLLCFAASIYGVLLVFSATHSSISGDQLVSSEVRRMIQAIIIGLIGGFVISYFKPETIAKLAPYIGAGCILLMVITIFFGVGPENGSDDTAWLVIGGFYFQPSELAKIGFIITFSVHLKMIGEDIDSFKNIVLLGIHALIPILLVAKTGDDGSAILFLLIAVTMMFAAGVKLVYFIAGATAVIIGFAVAWITDLIPNFQKERFLVVLYPDRDPKGFAFQQNQSVNAIGSGKIFGKGFLQGTYTQSQSVPESQNDFIMSVAGEEFGFLGCLAIVILLAAIVIRIIRVGSKADNPMASFMCYGVAGMIMSQSFLNIGMCLRLLPVIGITLPFFSSGGSSNMCIYFGIGLVLSVYRNKTRKYPRNYRIF